MGKSYAEVERFLQGWKPFAELAGTAQARHILALLAADKPEVRQRRLLAACDLYRLLRCYEALGLLREGRNERAEQFERLLSLRTADLAASIARGEQKEPLGLLQYCLEFGRHALPPRHTLMRGFILALFELDAGGVGMKYSLYPGGVLFTAGGKTHEEMVRELARQGLGGTPLAGGTIARTGRTAFLYDMASTAFRATNDPEAVKAPLLRWIRNTGGQDDKVELYFEAKRTGA
ncbi:MAG TPA: hypothetical protein VKB51_09830 [bacterium]|nr:hypothetical protein [bacterium]